MIELIVTVAIVGILTTIAVPSYQQFLRKGRRQTATSCLVDLQQRMEGYYQRRNAYPAALTDLSSDGKAAVCPQASPKDDYAIALMPATAVCKTPGCYELQATPLAGSPQVKDGYLSLKARFDPDPNKRIVRARFVGAVQKGWDDN